MNRKILAILFAAAFAAAGLHAQQPTAKSAQTLAAQPADQQGDVNAPVIRLGVNEVSLIFTVTDRHGHYNPNLKQSDFALLDDQKAPARVNSFHQQINLPLRVGIIIDTSKSLRLAATVPS